MIDVQRYPEWNPFIQRIESPVPPEVGDPIRLHVLFGNGKRVVSPERVTALRRRTTTRRGAQEPLGTAPADQRR